MRGLNMQVKRIPQIGSDVWYRSDVAPHRFPAKVTRVHKPDDPASMVDLIVFGRFFCESALDVRPDPAGLVNHSWGWPPEERAVLVSSAGQQVAIMTTAQAQAIKAQTHTVYKI